MREYLMINQLEILSPILAQVLIYGAGLSLVIGLLAWALLKVMPQFISVNAATRYAVWVSSLVLIFAVHIGLMATHVPWSQLNVFESETLVSSSDEGSNFDAVDMVAMNSVPSVVLEATEETTFSEASPHLESSMPAAALAPAAQQSPFTFSRIPSLLMMVLLVAFLVGMALNLFRLFAGVIQVVELQRRSRDLAHHRLSRPLLASLRRSVRIKESDRVKSPSAAGLFSSTVLIPSGLSTELSEEAMSQIILHEAAHLDRWDDWTILIQRLAESVFFFNPLVWWIASLMSVEREIACDDWVVSRTGKPRDYVESINELVHVQSSFSTHRLTPGLASRPESLFDRMKRVLENGIPDSAKMSREQVALLSGLTLLLVSLVFVSSPFVNFDFSFTDTDSVPESVDAVEPVEFSVSVVVPPADIVFDVDISDIAHVPEISEPSEPFDIAIATTHDAYQEPELADGIELSISVRSPSSDSDKLSVRSWIQVLGGVAGVSSDPEKSRLLIFAVNRMPADDMVVEAYLKASETISADAERARALIGFYRGRDLEGTPLLQLIAATAGISSDSEKSKVLTSIIRSAPTNRDVREALQSAIQSVGNSSEAERLITQYSRRFDG